MNMYNNESITRLTALIIFVTHSEQWYMKET